MQEAVRGRGVAGGTYFLNITSIKKVSSWAGYYMPLTPAAHEDEAEELNWRLAQDSKTAIWKQIGQTIKLTNEENEVQKNQRLEDFCCCLF